jgi:hypothetical protein
MEAAILSHAEILARRSPKRRILTNLIPTLGKEHQFIRLEIEKD